MITEKYDHSEKRNKNFITRVYKTCSDFYKSPKYRQSAGKFKKILNINKKFLSPRDIYKNKKNILNDYHRSLLLQKLHSVTYKKINNNETRICRTERNRKAKTYKDNFFVTKINNFDNKFYNNCETANSNYCIETSSNKNRVNLYKNKINTDLLIPALCFIELDLRKYKMHNYPDLIKPKTSDFISEIKAVQKMNYVTKLKNETSKFKQDLIQLNLEEYKLDLYSLKSRKKLLEKYYSSFLRYNKYLFDTIKKEQIKLKKIIDKENKIFAEIGVLVKKIDNVKYEIEVSKNYKKLYELIQNKINSTRINITKIKKNNDNIETKKTKKFKIFKVSENIKNTFRSSKRYLSMKEMNSSKSIINTDQSKKNIREKIKNKNSSNPHLKNIKNSFENSSKNSGKKLQNDSHKKIKKQSIITTTEITLVKNKESSYDENENENNNNNNSNNNNNAIEPLYEKNFGEMFNNETEIIENQIIKSMKKYISLNSDNFEMKLKNHLINEAPIDPILILINQRTIELNFLKNKNLSLSKELSELINQHDDNTFMFFMTKKMRYIISHIISFDYLKDFIEIFNKLKKLYKLNPEKITYCNAEKQRIDTFKYIDTSIILVENLFTGLITKRNEIKKDVESYEKLAEIENKMDMIKKFEKSKNKRIEEMKKRNILNENMIKKMNKIFYKPIKPVAQRFNFSVKRIKNKKREATPANEYDELFDE